MQSSILKPQRLWVNLYDYDYKRARRSEGEEDTVSHANGVIRIEYFHFKQAFLWFGL